LTGCHRDRNQDRSGNVKDGAHAALGGSGGSGARGAGLPSVRTRKRLSRLINRLPPTLALWITLAAIILWIVACDKLESAIASFTLNTGRSSARTVADLVNGTTPLK
jgi:hypothetical protein